jgi:hypothetical protein
MSSGRNVEPGQVLHELKSVIENFTSLLLYKKFALTVPGVVMKPLKLLFTDHMFPSYSDKKCDLRFSRQRNS